MKMLKTALVVGALASAIAAPSFATGVHHTWKFDSASAGVNPGQKITDRAGGSLHNQSKFYSDNGMKLKSDGWHENMKQNGRAISSGHTNSLRNRSGEFQFFESGVGFNSYGDNWHTIDNSGADELVVWEFAEAVSLREFKFGYAREMGNSNHVADATILYRDPAKDDNSGLGHMNTRLQNGGHGSITDLGYKVLGHFADIKEGVNNNLSALTGGAVDTIYSKVWAIGAYLGALSNTGTNYGNGLSAGNDGFKLASIGAKTADPVTPPPPTPVPAPATLALLGLGCLLMRRRATTR